MSGEPCRACGNSHGCPCWRAYAQEKQRCAKILEGKRMLQEAYADPGRQREPKPREDFAIALLWEAEREILGYPPRRYLSAAEEAANPMLAAFQKALDEIEAEPAGLGRRG